MTTDPRSCESLTSLETELRAALDWAKAQKLQIVDDQVIGRNCCCLLGAVLLQHNLGGGYYVAVAAERLQILCANATDLEAGFMNCPTKFHQYSSPYFLLGQKLREAYKPVTAYVFHRIP